MKIEKKHKVHSRISMKFANLDQIVFGEDRVREEKGFRSWSIRAICHQL
jgi:hypothetical protein